MTSSAADLLKVMRTATETAAAVEVERLLAVLDYAELHRTDDDGDAATHLDHGIPLAGEGAPWVSEFAVMELGAVLGMSTDSAKRYLGAAMEIRYRLPRIWDRVTAGQLGFWKARWIAERTMCLPLKGAAFVDARVGFCAHKVSFAEVDRQIATAVATFDPEQAEKKRRQEADRRHVDIDVDNQTIEGTIDMHATVDAQDALDFNPPSSRSPPTSRPRGRKSRSTYVGRWRSGRSRGGSRRCPSRTVTARVVSRQDFVLPQPPEAARRPPTDSQPPGAARRPPTAPQPPWRR